MFFFTLCFFLNFISLNADKVCQDLKEMTGSKEFINEIFIKYGSGNSTISLSSFNALMSNISLGKIEVLCEPNDIVCEKEGIAQHFKLGRENDHNHDRKRRRRDDLEEHHQHWLQHIKSCLKPIDILKLHNMSEKNGLSKDDFLRVCPSLLHQIDSKACLHEHVKILGHLHDNSDLPTVYESWGYGLLSITVISLLSISVISIIPCLKKAFYHVIMSYLVALAVGTLAGDAMLHLIPHAFAEGANSAASLRISREDELKQHYSQVWRALFVLLGIYLFFVVEQLMKAKALCFGKSHGHSHGKKERKYSTEKDSDVSSESNHFIKEPKNDESLKKELSEEKEKLGNEGKNKLNHVLSCESSMHLQLEEGSKTHFHADDRHHHHHHNEKKIDKTTAISSLALMVIVGDGFHNFSDGLAVGAAFSASLSSGLSTAIAVFCHELPHELGDFAILINSGMTIKRAIIYNLVSALLSYLGLVVGIFVGEYEIGRHFILSVTAGLFLYVALADMLPELMHQEVPDQSLKITFICQHLGILSGIGMMLFISLFEHSF
uniref:Zinc transporter ZIP14 n=1 Tax=Hydra vulgaris TaxID=6087 RepID=T2MCM1_HYDVU